MRQGRRTFSVSGRRRISSSVGAQSIRSRAGDANVRFCGRRLSTAFLAYTWAVPREVIMVASFAYASSISFPIFSCIFFLFSYFIRTTPDLILGMPVQAQSYFFTFFSAPCRHDRDKRTFVRIHEKRVDCAIPYKETQCIGRTLRMRLYPIL